MQSCVGYKSVIVVHEGFIHARLNFSSLRRHLSVEQYRLKNFFTVGTDLSLSLPLPAPHRNFPIHKVWPTREFSEYLSSAVAHLGAKLLDTRLTRLQFVLANQLHSLRNS